jgi:hypothetical protein
LQGAIGLRDNHRTLCIGATFSVRIEDLTDEESEAFWAAINDL